MVRQPHEVRQFNFIYREPQKELPLLSAFRRKIATIRIKHSREVSVVDEIDALGVLLTQPKRPEVTIESLRAKYSGRRGKWDINDPEMMFAAGESTRPTDIQRAGAAAALLLLNQDKNPTE